jgi:ribosomal protein L7/L12
MRLIFKLKHQIINDGCYNNLTILVCLFILAVVITILISSRRKERTVFNTDKIGGISTGNFDERLKSLIDQWKIMDAVKLVRETKGLGLKESKDYINKFMRGEEYEEIAFESAENEEVIEPEELDGKVFELLMKKRKIDAIKLVKENLDIGLKEAKDYVEEIEKKLNL